MRIISQDGRTDMPYNKAIVIIDKDCGTTEKCTIFAYTERGVQILAKYSTVEKGVKVMEMCRQAYANLELNKKILPALTEDIKKMPNKEREKYMRTACRKYVFRFPKDNEVKDDEYNIWVKN